MKRIIYICLLLFFSFTTFSQKRKIKLAVQGAYMFYTSINDYEGITTGNVMNSAVGNLGLNFQQSSNNQYLYLTYSYIQNGLYKGNYLGLNYEFHFLSSGHRIRPYLGLSVLTEFISNFRKGYIEVLFQGTNVKTNVFSPSDVFYENSPDGWNYLAGKSRSGFYMSTPLISTIYIGGSVLLSKNLFLNFSIGYGLQIILYKYLDYYNGADDLKLLSQQREKGMFVNYLTAKLGISYSISLHKHQKPE